MDSEYEFVGYYDGDLRRKEYFAQLDYDHPNMKHCPFHRIQEMKRSYLKRFPNSNIQYLPDLEYRRQNREKYLKRLEDKALLTKLEEKSQVGDSEDLENVLNTQEKEEEEVEAHEEEEEEEKPEFVGYYDGDLRREGYESPEKLPPKQYLAKLDYDHPILKHFPFQRIQEMKRSYLRRFPNINIQYLPDMEYKRLKRENYLKRLEDKALKLEEEKAQVGDSEDSGNVVNPQEKPQLVSDDSTKTEEEVDAHEEEEEDNHRSKKLKLEVL